MWSFAGEPKAIPWTHVTPIRAATDAFAQIDVRRGDVFAWPTNLVRHTSPLLLQYNTPTIAPVRSCRVFFCNFDMYLKAFATA